MQRVLDRGQSIIGQRWSSRTVVRWRKAYGGGLSWTRPPDANDVVSAASRLQADDW